MRANNIIRIADPDEFVACNVCGSAASRPLFAIGRFHIVECRECGLAYTNPRVRAAELRSIYAAAYFCSPDSLIHGYVDYVREKASIQRTFRQRWQNIRDLVARPGRLLEIGCAHGFLLEIVEQDGWDAVGLDTSPEAIAYARDVLNLNAQLSDASAIPFADESFDVIVMWDVIEHVPDPSSILQSCARKLRRGGVLSIITPDRGSLLARATGRRWVEYQKPHEHLYFFSRAVLRKPLERAGLRVIATETTGKYVELGFALERLVAVNPRIFRPLLAIVRAVGAAKVVTKINPRDKMHVIARKPLTH